jgi:adenylate cyclase
LAGNSRKKATCAGQTRQARAVAAASQLASVALLGSDWSVARWWKKRWFVHLGIVLLMVLAVLPFSLPQSAPSHWLWKLAWTKFQSLEDSTINYRVTYFRRAPVNPQLVFLAIDTPSVLMDASAPATIAASKPLSLMARGFPYPRDFYAYLCDRLFGAGAKAVALDVIFQNPRPGDDTFAAALQKYRGNFVLGMNFSDDLENNFSPLAVPPASLLPSQSSTDELLGYLNFWPDADQVIRDAQYRTNPEEVSQHPMAATVQPKLYSLAARLVKDAGYGNLVPNDMTPRVLRFTRVQRVPTFSLYQLFEPDIWTTTFQNGAYFKDKIVFVGPKGDWSKDQVITPLGQMNGAELHINAINALLERQFLTPASNGLVLLFILAFGAAAFFLGVTIVPIGWRFLAALGVMAGYGVAGIAAYDGPGWLLPTLAPGLVCGGSMTVGFIYDFVLTQIEKFQLRTTFERYTSKNVARYLLENPDGYQEMLAGTRKAVTILFSDVRNFTTMSEEAAAQGRSQQHIAKLNEYLTAMVDCVFRQDGALDKFIGDAIMAVWGNTPYNFGPKGDAIRAVKSALSMLEEMKRLNARWRAAGEAEWRIGIGLNHGEVIAGDMGSPQRKEFAVLGDAVNLASRLEGLTKSYDLELLLGESVAPLVGDEFHLLSVDLVQVKGKTKAVEVFTVLGAKAGPLSPEKQRFVEAYGEGIKVFRARDFATAKKLFEEALAAQPGDTLAADYLASCDTFIENPPDAAWRGVRVMKEK